MKLETFKKLYQLDIVKDIEKDYKGLNYLSWATAYKLAMEQDPAMTYEVLTADDGLQFFSRGDVHIVKTKVTMFGDTKEMFLPIMDNKHNAVKNPNSKDVGNNIMRCLAKNIAMFGIGLPLYVGEDLKDIVKQGEDRETINKYIELILKDTTEEQGNYIDDLVEKLKKKNIAECNLDEIKGIYKDFTNSLITSINKKCDTEDKKKWLESMIKDEFKKEKITKLTLDELKIMYKRTK